MLKIKTWSDNLNKKKLDRLIVPSSQEMTIQNILGLIERKFNDYIIIIKDVKTGDMSFHTNNGLFTFKHENNKYGVNIGGGNISKFSNSINEITCCSGEKGELIANLINEFVESSFDDVGFDLNTELSRQLNQDYELVSIVSELVKRFKDDLRLIDRNYYSCFVCLENV